MLNDITNDELTHCTALIPSPLEGARRVVNEHRALYGPTHPGTRWAELVAERGARLLELPGK